MSTSQPDPTDILKDLHAKSRTDRPCPHWCDQEAGHPWESRTSKDEAMRFHEKHFEPVTPRGPHLSVTIEETAAASTCCDDWGRCDHPQDAYGPSTFSTPVVSLFDAPDDLEPDVAVRFAEQLVLAAEACTRYRQEAETPAQLSRDTAPAEITWVAREALALRGSTDEDRRARFLARKERLLAYITVAGQEV